MALTPGRIHGGAARIFVGVTAPATGTPPTLMTHTDGVPGTGSDVGSTQGDTMLTIQATKSPIEIEQSLAPVDVLTIAEMSEITFTCVEHVHVAIQRALDNVGVVSDGSKDLYYWGNGTSILAPRTEAVMITSRQRNAPTKFIVTVLYKVFFPDGLKLPYKRKGESVFQMKCIALADTARNAGDQVVQHFWEK